MRVTSKITSTSASSGQVYAKLSDLENLSPLVARLQEQSPSLPMGIEVERIDLTSDSVTVSLGDKGTVSLQRVGAEPCKLLKFASQGVGKEVNLWIQLLEKIPGTTHLRLTMEVDVPFLMRKLVEGKIKEAMDKAADALVRLPYNR